MSLTRMGKSADRVRFLDDVDLTFSFDSRTSSSHQMTNIEISAKPIIFRASYRDIILISSIINKAVERYGRSPASVEEQQIATNHSAPSTQRTLMVSSDSANKKTRSRTEAKAMVLMSKEQVN